MTGPKGDAGIRRCRPGSTTGETDMASTDALVDASNRSVAPRLDLPFVDLARQHRAARAQLDAAYDRVITRGSFTLGDEVDAFEREFARFVGVKDAIGVGSGTDALHFALRACGVGPGDEVITAVNTFAATAEAIVMCGATPVFVDIDEATYLMDLHAFENAITAKSRAVVPVHLYGQCVDMTRLLDIAARNGLKVIEDACQAHGAQLHGYRAGAAGDAGCFSFYPSKNLGALGDGGMVTTNDAGIARRVRSLRNHGEDDRRLHVESGYCSRLHGLQAAFLRAKLPFLEEWNSLRIETAGLFDDALADSGIITPATAPGALHVHHLYVVRVRERDRVRQALAERGIQTAIHYAVPLHLEPAFAGCGYARGDFPVAERVVGEILSLPMYPYISEDEALGAAAALREVARV
jgi:dTDP-4-amino-4,6-dideoxygalactose transaminase